MTKTQLYKFLIAIILSLIYLVCWLVVLRIYVALTIFQSYRDLEAVGKLLSEIIASRPGIEPWTIFSTLTILKILTTTSLLLKRLFAK